MKFSDALDRKAEDIVQPPNLPLGDYIWMIQKAPETRQINDTLESLRFQCVCVEATESVMPEELEEYGKVQGTIVSKDFLFNTAPEEEVNFERALNSVKMFLQHCGLDNESATLKELLADSLNQQFVGELKHRPDKNDPEKVYQEIGKTAPVE